MVIVVATRLIDIPELRDRNHVFRDRSHAGRLLSQILGEYRHRDALVLAIPAGGIPVAAAVGRCLNLPVDIAVVSKITFPWNTEAGYGLFSKTTANSERIEQGGVYVSACDRIAHSVETIVPLRISHHVDELTTRQGVQIYLTMIDGIGLEREVEILHR